MVWGRGLVVFSILATVATCRGASRTLLQTSSGTQASGGSGQDIQGVVTSPGPLACNCPTTYTPVCGADNQTYGNACVAGCANVKIASQGHCPQCGINKQPDCICGGQGYSPVCANGLTFNTPCDADCGYRFCHTPGVCVYQADGATAVATTGGSAKGLSSATGNTALPSPGAPPFNYAEALHKALLFYETMKSGTLNQQRLAWRSDSCFNCKGPGGEDVSGGFYEAGGSFLKLGLPSAYVVTNLAWGIVAFPDGYKKSGQMSEAENELRWGADYLVKAFAAPNKFVAVVGNDTEDFDYYGPVEEYEMWVPTRPSYYISTSGSEIMGEAAAALAASTLALGAGAPGSYLTAARSLYTFGKSVSKSYMDSSEPGIDIHKKLYDSKDFKDELAWGAAWLYLATKDASYQADAVSFYNQQCSEAGYTYEVGKKCPALHVLMQQVDAGNAGAYAAKARQFFDQYLNGGINTTPKGLVYPYSWGAARPAAASAFLALVYSKQLRGGGGDATYAARLFNYAQYQVDYLLGASGRSWLIGFGSDYPRFVWHKLSYNAYIDWPTRGRNVWLGEDRGPWTSPTTGPSGQPVTVELAKLDIEGSRTPQRFIAYGALFAAPLQDDGLVAGRKDYTKAEPTTEGQGGITGALAGLCDYYAVAPASDCGLDLGWSHPNATRTAKSVVPQCSS